MSRTESGELRAGSTPGGWRQGDGDGKTAANGLPVSERPEFPPQEAFGNAQDPKAPEAFGRAEPKTPQQKGRPGDPPDGKAGNEQEKKGEGDPKEGGEKPRDGGDKKEDKPKKPPFYKRPVLMAVLIGVFLLAAIVVTVWYLNARQFESTDDAFIDGHTIPVSPQVAGPVKEVLIDDNFHVKAGDVLVKLDPRDYQVVLDQKRDTEKSMQSKVEQARTQYKVAEANVGEAQAEVDVAQTTAANAERDFQRFQALDERARSQQQFDNATATQKSSAATVQQARAKLLAAQAQVLDAQAAVGTAEADARKAADDTRQAEINLGYCTITAPEDGVVTKKNVEPGMYLSVGQALFSIVPTEVWVTANFKETQLDLMRPGDPVTIKVDAYPEKEFRGRVDSIQTGTGSKFTLLPPENATGNFVKVVQRVPVKIVFDPGETGDQEHVLAPGMSVEPKIRVRNVEPRPPQTRPSLFESHG